MVQLFTAALRALWARKGGVAVVALLLGAPAALFGNASPAQQDVATNALVLLLVSAVLGVSACAAIAGLLLVGLRPAAVDRSTLSRRVRTAIVRTLATEAALFGIALGIGIVLFALFTVMGLVLPFRGNAVTDMTMLAVVLVYAALMLPFNLVVPINIAEPVGVTDAIVDAWDLASSNMTLVCVPIAVVQIAAFAAASAVRGTGQAGFVAAICVGVVSVTLQAALLAALYDRLAPRVPEPDVEALTWSEQELPKPTLWERRLGKRR